ncbi:MAG: hypothetical protein ACOYMQ_04325 [Pseudanabaena sp.]|jgi:hypothetical protein
MVQAAIPQVKYLSYEEYYAYDDGSDTHIDPVRSQITLLSWVEGFYEEAIYTGDVVIKSGVIPEIEIDLRDILG